MITDDALAYSLERYETERRRQENPAGNPLLCLKDDHRGTCLVCAELPSPWIGNGPHHWCIGPWRLLDKHSDSHTSHLDRFLCPHGGRAYRWELEHSDARLHP